MSTITKNYLRSSAFIRVERFLAALLPPVSTFPSPG